MLRAILMAIIFLFATGCQSTMNRTIVDRDARLREFIAGELEADESPGIQYVVLSKDSVLFSCAAGLADIAAHREMRESTTMMIYSMTKTITAAAVLQLVEQGKLSLDDPVMDYLPDIPYGKEVRVRHLLSQTSGIPNPIPLKWVHLVQEHDQFDERAALGKIMRENADLSFSPGEEYGYSNISYWLLGHIIEKASGTRFEEYVGQHIFRNLGIPESQVGFAIPSAQQHAKGYLPKWSFIDLFKSVVIDSAFIGDYEDGWLHINDHYLNGPSFGGMVATARALGIFLQDQLQDTSRLFTAETKALFFQQQKANNGEPIGMTLGWHIGNNDGVWYFFKEGGGGGFHCEMRVYPVERIASVAIANNISFSPSGFLNAADREFHSQDSGKTP
ncbi:class A beta-lactamase-related serine hydrolase [bacterium]|nr:MAG: class A beta-lactamase-related serine hydrolase [bacterium]